MISRFKDHGGVRAYSMDYFKEPHCPMCGRASLVIVRETDTWNEYCCHEPKCLQRFGFNLYHMELKIGIIEPTNKSKENISYYTILNRELISDRLRKINPEFGYIGMFKVGNYHFEWMYTNYRSPEIYIKYVVNAILIRDGRFKCNIGKPIGRNPQ